MPHLRRRGVALLAAAALSWAVPASATGDRADAPESPVAIRASLAEAIRRGTADAAGPAATTPAATTPAATTPADASQADASRADAAAVDATSVDADADAAQNAVIDIPFTRFVLDNGLTLIVHEDHKAPIVAVNVWYHVGSKNETPGRTGFAHLFEHLMFNGSEHFDDDWFQALERVGATDLNGTTSEDRTNYFQNVPTTALDQALWLESDRMGHLLEAITQEKLDEQRGVVQNEKRQGEDAPYGKVWNLLTRASYPAGHPYSWPVIGSMEDLDAATLDDVRTWFRTYYGAANATLVIAGDVDTDDVRRRVERCFGHIPSGPPLTRPAAWVARRTEETRLQHEDRVPQARLYKVWNVPAWGTVAADRLELVAGVLGRGKTSRLYKRLVYDDQLCTDVTVGVYAAELGGAFYLWATAQPGGDLTAVEAALDEELTRFLEEGPTETEVRRVRTEYLARVVRGAERIGGFGGKSDLLAESQVLGGRPDYYKTRLDHVRRATAVDLRGTAAQWLATGAVVLAVHPFPDYHTRDEDVDRTALPPVTSFPTPGFPPLQSARLDNGLRVLLAERHGVPLVEIRLLVGAGYAAETVPGTARLTMDMLDEGTASRSALQISQALSLLGARLRTGADLDVATVSLSALADRLDASLEIFADVVAHPAFPAAEFERRRRQQLAAIQREQTTPRDLAWRVFPGLLYGTDHPYGRPLSGTGTQSSVRSLEGDDLAGFHRAWMRPGNATLVAVGDVSMQRLTELLDRHLGDWHDLPVPEVDIPTVAAPEAPRLYLVDRPGSSQSVVLAATLAPPRTDPRDLALTAVNDILGGTFTSRINMNLREDKGWSYGARSRLLDTRRQRPLVVYAAVQTDRTAESLAEMRRELTAIAGDEAPPTAAELERVKQGRSRRLPGRWETDRAVAGAVAEMVRFGLPEDYWHTYADRVRGLDLEAVTRAARDLIVPRHVVWVVVGDQARVEEPLRKLGLGPVHRLDADGKPR